MALTELQKSFLRNYLVSKSNIVDPDTGEALDWDALGGDVDLSGYQPIDADLTAIAALTTTSYGRALLALADAAALRTAVGDVGSNLITNGRFRTNQRGYASAASLASGAYGFDRWKATTASTTLTYSVALQGQSITINSGGSVAQVVERGEIPAGNYVLSWVGTATGRVYNSGGSVPSYAASPVTVTLDGTADVVVEFQASGATKTLDMVKLEAGSIPSAYVAPSQAAELLECQRFYQTVSGWQGIGSGGTAIEMSCQFQPIMRANPSSITKYPSAPLNYRDISGTPDQLIAAGTWGIANASASIYGMWMQFTGVTGAASSRPFQSRFGSYSGPCNAVSADL